MTREVVPSACHHTETLLRYLRMCTPKVLIVPTSGLVEAQRYKEQHTLGKENRGVNPDRLAGIWLVVRADRRHCGDEGGACEAGRG